MKINSKADLNAAVAESIGECHEITKMNWWEAYIRESGVPRFATDPAASFALEQEMRKQEFQWAMDDTTAQPPNAGWLVSCAPVSGMQDHRHASRFIAMALAALAAKGITLELAEGWEER